MGSPIRRNWAAKRWRAWRSAFVRWNLRPRRGFYSQTGAARILPLSSGEPFPADIGTSHARNHLVVTRSASRRDHRALSIPRDLISCLTKGVTPFPYRCDRSGSSRSFLSFSSETRDLLTRCSLSRHALSLVRKDATMEKRATAIEDTSLKDSRRASAG